MLSPVAAHCRKPACPVWVPGSWGPSTAHVHQQLEQLRLYLLGHRAEVAYSFTLCKVVLRKGDGKSQLTG